MRLSLLTSFLIIFSNAAQAQDAARTFAQKIEVRTEIVKGNLLFGAEVTSLDSSIGNKTTGFGPRLGVEYDLGHDLSINPNVSFVGSDLSSYLYSGVNGFLKYNISGTLTQSRQIILKDGQRLVDQQSQKENRLAVGVGLEQLFLNGSQSVFPAAGPSIGASYTFQLGERDFEATLRYSSLTANSKTISGLFLDFSFLLGL